MVGVRTFSFITIPHMVLELDWPLTEYNPRYFDEPEKYRPSRWYGISNDEAFSAFSIGMCMVFPTPSNQPLFLKKRLFR